MTTEKRKITIPIIKVARSNINVMKDAQTMAQWHNHTNFSPKIYRSRQIVCVVVVVVVLIMIVALVLWS